MTQPVLVQRLENAVIFLGMLAAYFIVYGNWWLFVPLWLTIDLTTLGYLGSPKLGAFVYNLGHNYAGPLILLALGYYISSANSIYFAIIWMSHVALDRALGFGLKSPDGFKHTHLGLLGGAKNKPAAKLAK